MNAQILIKTTNDWFEFSKSKTGQLDYIGKWENIDKPRVDDAQEFVSSTFHSPCWYVYIQSELNCNPTVYVAPDVDVSDKDIKRPCIWNCLTGELKMSANRKYGYITKSIFWRRGIEWTWWLATSSWK